MTAKKPAASSKTAEAADKKKTAAKPAAAETKAKPSAKADSKADPVDKAAEKRPVSAAKSAPVKETKESKKAGAKKAEDTKAGAKAGTRKGADTAKPKSKADDLVDDDLVDVEAELDPVEEIEAEVGEVIANAKEEKVKPLRMKGSRAKERALMREFGLES